MEQEVYSFIKIHKLYVYCLAIGNVSGYTVKKSCMKTIKCTMFTLKDTLTNTSPLLSYVSYQLKSLTEAYTIFDSIKGILVSNFHHFSK